MYKFKTNSIENGCCAGLMVKQTDSSREFIVKLKKCWPPRGDIVDYVPLKTGDRVKLLPFKVSNKCFVCPSGKDILDERAEMLDHVNVKASKRE